MDEKKSNFVDQLHRAGIKYGDVLDIEEIAVSELRKEFNGFAVADPTIEKGK